MNLKLILSFITLFLFAFIGAGSVEKMAAFQVGYG